MKRPKLVTLAAALGLLVAACAGDEPDADVVPATTLLVPSREATSDPWG